MKKSTLYAAAPVPAAPEQSPTGPLKDFPKLAAFFEARQPETPCLAVDTDIVEAQYKALVAAVPDALCFYAIKANPARPILDRMVKLGANYDCASLNEILMVLEAGASPANVLFGNTIKKANEIAEAHRHGVMKYACDSMVELEKIAKNAPGSKVFCRIIVSNSGAAWPLSKKFGCTEEMALEILRKATELGLVPYGISFHVGSQQMDVTQWRDPILRAAGLMRELAQDGIHLKALNLGGGFPARYRQPVPPVEAYGQAIVSALNEAFGEHFWPEVMLEPGRYICGDAGVIQAEVVLISPDAEDPNKRWVYLDAGKFSGLIEPESIEYRIVTEKDGDPMGPVVIAGPTCDSVDVLYENSGYELPLTLAVGDKVYLLSTGAYTTTYSAIAFNGFPPLKDYYV